MTEEPGEPVWPYIVTGVMGEWASLTISCKRTPRHVAKAKIDENGLVILTFPCTEEDHR